MARSLTAGAIAAKNAQYGSEPVCILGVAWGGGNEIKYAEKTTPFATGKISAISPVNEIVQLDSNSTTSSVSVTLLDPDGSLKAILDSVDVHKNRATLYQWFEGLAESDAFVIFVGQVNSPITWSETDRTVSFTVISQIESLEVGFSPEEGQFANVSPNLIGKTWPLVFGEAVHVPAVKSVEKTRGATQTLIGIPDYTLPYKYWHLRERLDILREGFQYYKSAIYYLLNTLPLFPFDSEVTQAGNLQQGIATSLSANGLDDATAINLFFNYISVTAQGLEDTLVNLILGEDARRQSFEDVNVFITEQGKKSDDVAALLDEDSDENLTIEVLNELLAALEEAWDELQALMNENITFEEDNDPSQQKATIISVASNEIDAAKKAVTEAGQQEAPDFDVALQAIVDAYIALLDAAKRCSELTDKQLEAIKGEKDIINVDIENAEYTFQNIKMVLGKVNKLYVNRFKTEREIYKVNAAIQQHNTIPKFQVLVTDGERFPQNTPVTVSINDMTYSGTFVGKLFTVAAIMPRYSNLGVVVSSRLIDSFDLADPTVDIRGHYCLVSVPTTPSSPDYDPSNPFGYRIFQVTNQVGTRCTMQLLELNPVVGRAPANRSPLINQLPDYLWGALSQATEHTEEEKRRILEDAIPKYDADELSRIRTNLDKLEEMALEAPDADTISVINEGIYSNIREYNDKVANLTYKREAVEKVESKISDEEFRNFLRLQNLKYRLSDTNDEDYELIRTDRYYYVTGYDVSFILSTSPTMLPSWFQYAPQGQEIAQDSTVITLPNGSRIKANLLPDSALWYAEVGSTVELINDQREKYIVSILPGTIASVYAYRSLNGTRQLVPVPSRYYTKNEADNYGGLTCTSITLHKRLQDYPNEGWEDGLYVSIASTVGPNTVDIIEWIAENYTDLSIDSTSFDSVRAAVENYPSSFALFNKKDALTLIREIAWQARCSVWILNGVLYIRYLSVAPSSVATITESHILPQSLELQHTETEDLVTKFEATWKPNYAVNDPNKIILRHNIAKYGTKEESYDFYIYNIEDLVHKSATFWMIRKANTWKLAVFKTPLLDLQVQALDGLTLDVNPNHFATDPVLGVVRNASYEVEDNSINFVVWLPIRAGEMVPYDFAFPSSIETNTVYPTVTEIASGNAGGGGSNVPTSLAFNIDPNTNLIDQLTFRPKDYGKAFLSDSYDSYPTSPIANLSEEDYVSLRPEKYNMPGQPRSGEINAKPEYRTPEQNRPVITEAPVFVGRISEVVDADTGQYKVRVANNREYAIQQYNGGTEPLNRNDPVTVIRDPLTGQYVVNERVQSPGTSIAHYEVVSEKDDYLICKAYDPETDETEDEEIAIAKPRLLRRSPFDGETIEFPDKSITYTYFPELDEEGEEVEEEENPDRYRLAETQVSVTNPGGDEYETTISEAQRIVPHYFVGDILTAVRAATGLSTDEEEPTPINWTDLNTGGRVWAHSPKDDPEEE